MVGTWGGKTHGSERQSDTGRERTGTVTGFCIRGFGVWIPAVAAGSPAGSFCGEVPLQDNCLASGRRSCVVAGGWRCGNASCMGHMGLHEL